MNNPILMVDLNGMESDTSKIKMPTIQLAEVAVTLFVGKPNLSLFARLLLAGAAADLATPEPTDAYLPKIVVEGAIVGVFIGFVTLKNYFDYSKKTDKEKSTDVPFWARGEKPKSGENGKKFTKRLMDEKYGVGNWKDPGPGSEYSQIKKSGDRNIN
ncbi:hypothetical protein ACP6L2_14910 [Sphingobacterium lactis]|uniref:hypothetical protein n=1 Tax=Sphingobacterium lactis TaxID=797291 RepID=UPI003F806AE9